MWVSASDPGNHDAHDGTESVSVVPMLQLKPRAPWRRGAPEAIAKPATSDALVRLTDEQTMSGLASLGKASCLCDPPASTLRCAAPHSMFDAILDRVF
jgi:hypothetical protein